MLKEDCKNVTCNSQPHYAGGHMIHEEVHCYDGACTCMPAMIQGNVLFGGRHYWTIILHPSGHTVLK